MNALRTVGFDSKPNTNTINPSKSGRTVFSKATGLVSGTSRLPWWGPPGEVIWISFRPQTRVERSLLRLNRKFSRSIGMTFILTTRLLGAVVEAAFFPGEIVRHVGPGKRPQRRHEWDHHSKRAGIDLVR